MARIAINVKPGVLFELLDDDDWTVELYVLLIIESTRLHIDVWEVNPGWLGPGFNSIFTAPSRTAEILASS